jgi:type VI secretion system protein ImpG
MELYNRELSLFYEHAEEFAEEYPGVAERLGSMLKDNPDPMIGALMEGAAFLATRVQLKLKHEFATFTNAMLEQLVPGFLAPLPSVTMVQVDPLYGDNALREGVLVPRNAQLDAVYRDRERRVACRYNLIEDLLLHPLEISGAEFFGSVAPLGGLGFQLDPDAMSGMRINFRVRSTAKGSTEPDPDKVSEQPNTWAQGLAIDKLTVHITDAEADAVAIYEQIFAHTAQIALRWRLPGGKYACRLLPVEDVLEQIGFGDNEALYPLDHRAFRGFNFIRDYLAFPKRFLGFRLRDFDRYLNGIKASVFELIFVFRDINPRLATVLDRGSFSLFCATAINLFEKTVDRILLTRDDHEYQVVPERTRYLEYEPHQILRVEAHQADRSRKAPVHPLYSSPGDQTDIRNALFYTIRRLQRRRTAEENRIGLRSDYMGTDMFLSLVGVDQAAERGEAPVELSIRALCTNRHLPEFLPVGETGADFRIADLPEMKVRAVAPPTPPREPILTAISDRSKVSFAGENAWRLINVFSLNHLGLVQNRAGESAQALRDVLSLFADLRDSVIERRIRGIRSVSARQVSRRVRAMSGVAAARGLEITITIEEKAFEGSGVFLMGAVLDRFLAEYVGLNQFTQTVIRTPERREIMRWPPRMGRRHVL